MMKDQSKKKQALIQELVSLRQRVAKLEQSEADLKQVEEALREREESFRDMVENSQDLIFTHDPEGKLLSVNEAAVRLSGYSRESLLNMHLRDFLAPEVRNRFGAYLKEIQSQGRASGIMRIRTAGGETRHLEYNNILRAEGRAVPIVHGMARDITERKLAAAALHDSEERFRLFMDNSPTIAWMKDEQGRYVYISKTYENRFGVRSADWLGKTHFDLWPREVAEEFWKHDQAVLTAGRTIEVTETTPNPDGGLCHWWNFKIPLHDSSGKKYIGGIGVDITERKRAEESLKKSQEQLRDAHRLAHIGIWHWKADTDTVTWTEELYRIAGLDPMFPAPTYAEHPNIYAPESWDRLKEAVKKALETGAPYQLELELIRPDGATRWVDAFGGAAYDNHGRVTGLYGTVQDITERKQVEEELRESEENFRRSLRDSPLGVRIVTIEGETIYANRAILDIYGYDSIDEMRATPVVKRYTPESFAEFQIRREKRKRGDYDPSEYDISIVRKDGEVRHLNVFRKKVLWNGERQFQVLYNDITERKRAEEALQASESRYRMMSQIIPDFIYSCIHTDDGPYVVDWVTGGFTIVTGYPLDDFKGKACWIMSTIHHEDITIAEEQIESLKALSKNSGDFRILTKEGSIKWIKNHMQLIADEKAPGGLRLYGAVQDITKRKLAEEALRESENRILEALEFNKTILNTSSIGILTYKESGQCTYANDAVAKIVGTNVAGLLEQNFHQIQSWKKSEMYELAVKTLRTGTEQRIEPLVATSFGKDVWLSIRFSSFYSEGENHLLVFMYDITERKRAEEALKASHQQLRAFAGRLQSVREEQRKEFAREIHDQLGGAMTGLKIDLSFLASSAPKSWHITDRDSFLSKVNEMSKLIDETIGTVRRLVTELRPSILDDFGILAALEWQLWEFQKRTGIQSEFVSTLKDINMDEELSITVFRIFQEALTNVARHANATNVIATLYKEADSLVLKVEDNGKGISENDIHNAKSIGLTGMRERTLSLGGTISFSGEPSKGTTVSVQFPYKNTSPQA